LFLFVYNIFLKKDIVLNKGFIQLFYVFEEVIAISMASFFIVLIFRILKNYEKENIVINNSTLRVDVNWIKKLLNLGVIVLFMSVLTLIFGIYMREYSRASNYMLWIGVSFIIYWIGHKGLYQFRLAQDRIGIRELITKPDPVKELKLVVANKRTSGLPKNFNDTRENEKFKELQRLLQEDCAYRNSNLNQTLLAEQLDINVTYLSKLVNHVTGMSFSEYITSFRIEEAKTLLSNRKYNHYKIMAIGLEAGFTRASFYRLFKELTGLTPNEYRNKFLNSSTL
jgi:AraC-like DNA-binding protein